MSSAKFSVSIVAFLAAMVLVCQMESASSSVVPSAVNGTTNGVSTNKTAGLAVPPVVASNNHIIANASQRGVRGVGGAIAGGLASGAGMTLFSGLLGGRV